MVQRQVTLEKNTIEPASTDNKENNSVASVNNVKSVDRLDANLYLEEMYNSNVLIYQEDSKEQSNTNSNVKFEQVSKDTNAQQQAFVDTKSSFNKRSQTIGEDYVDNYLGDIYNEGIDLYLDDEDGNNNNINKDIMMNKKMHPAFIENEPVNNDVNFIEQESYNSCIAEQGFGSPEKKHINQDDSINADFEDIYIKPQGGLLRSMESDAESYNEITNNEASNNDIMENL